MARARIEIIKNAVNLIITKTKHFKEELTVDELNLLKSLKLNFTQTLKWLFQGKIILELILRSLLIILCARFCNQRFVDSNPIPRTKTCESRFNSPFFLARY